LNTDSVVVLNNTIRFVENKGQWQKNILYKAYIPGGAIFLEQKNFTYVFRDGNYHHHGNSKHTHEANKDVHGNDTMHNNPDIDITTYFAYKLHFRNSNDAIIRGIDQSEDYENYLIGNDQSKWATKVRNYKKVNYHNIYNNIDVNVYSKDNLLKYDIIVNPGANISDINIEYEGANNIYVESNGNLIIESSLNNGKVIELKPYCYQIINNSEIQIPCRYVVEGRQRVSFDISNYDKTLPLIIDPTLVASTFSGSYADNFGFSATYDLHNNIFSAGIVFSIGYPVSVGAYQTVFGGGDVDMGIIKYDSLGSKRIYATYLGGNSVDLPHSLIVNSANELIIYGTTGSSNYPITSNAYDKTFNGGTPLIVDRVLYFENGSDIIISRLSEDGSKLLASTYVGGTGNDGLNYDSITYGGSTYYYTYVPGIGWEKRTHPPSYFSVRGILRDNYADEIRGSVIVDDKDNIYVATSTHSTDFPTTSNAFQKNYGGGKQDGCVFKLDNNLNTLVWSSYIGGSGADGSYAITLDSKYNPVITGGTTSNNFPTTSNALNKSYIGGLSDGFVSVIKNDGSQILYSTYYGSDQQDQSFLVDINKDDDIYIFGQTRAKGSTLIKNAKYNKPNSGQFLAKFNHSLDSLYWSTVFGSGSGVPDISPTAMLVDLCNKIYLAGWGGDVNSEMGGSGTKYLEITPDAYQSTTDGNDFYLAVMNNDASALVYATFFGGPISEEHVDGGTSRFNKRGIIYQAVCGGCGGNSDMPTTSNAWSKTNNNYNCNNAVFVFSFELPTCIADFIPPKPDCAPYDAQFINISFTASPQKALYYWDFGDGQTSSLKDPIHTYTKAGDYIVTLVVIDTTSCNFRDTIKKQVSVIANFGSSNIDTLPSKTVCNGIPVQIGIDPFSDKSVSYKWSPSTYLSADSIANPYSTPTANISYTLSVTNGTCSAIYYQVVNVVDIKAYAGADTITCKNDIITLRGTSYGTANKFIWSSTNNYLDTLNNKLSDSSISIYANKKQTLYFKTIYNGCENTDNINIDLSEFDYSKTKDTTICFGDTTKIEIINKKSDSLFYQWGPSSSIIGPTNISYVIIAPTTNTKYTVTIKNKLNCIQIDTINVGVYDVKISTSTVDVSCFPKCDGMAIAKATSGYKPFTYSWNDSNKQTNDTAINLCSGTYIVSVSDSLGCRNTKQVTIKDKTAIKISFSKTDITCDYDTNGSISASVSGGTPPYTYLWSNGSVNSSISNLKSGYYIITVVDKNGCSVIDSIEIKAKSNINITSNKSNISCFGYNDGKIEIIVTGGIEPYKYSWSNNSTSQNLYNLSSGIYQLTVTDSLNCYKTHFDTIIEPKLLSVKINITPPSCTSSNDGKLTATPSGGTSPYTYSWNNGGKTKTINYLKPMTYIVTVTDKNGCSATNEAIITEPEKLQLSFDNENILCYNDSTGKITVNVWGGTPPYIYSWNTGSKNYYIDNLTVGTYTVTITDKNNCNIIDSTTLYQNPEIKVSFDVRNPLCNGTTTGEIIANVYGGVEPYLFKWSNGANNNIINNLASGKYYVTVRDKYNCAVTDSITVDEPAKITLSISKKDILCYGENTGEAIVTVAGGVPPYSYLWTNGYNSQQITKLYKSTYYITVTDSLGCQAIGATVINEPERLTSSIIHINPSCYNLNDGSAQVTVNGGTPPYKYLWDDKNNQTTSNAVNLSSGKYKITITDNNNCNIIDSTLLIAPEDIFPIFSLVNNSSCNSNCNGIASVTITGGTPPYSYIWENNIINQPATGLCNGKYKITIFDSNKCKKESEIEILDSIMLYVKTTKKEISCYNYCNGAIYTEISNAVFPVKYIWNTGDTGSYISNLCSGNYSVTITDNNNCQAIDNIELKNIDSLYITIEEKQDISCFDRCNGIINVKPVGGVPPYSFIWNTGNTNNYVDNLCAGSYYVTVKDANNCVEYAKINLEQPDTLKVNVSVKTIPCGDNLCENIAYATVRGGKKPYSYMWINGTDIKDVNIMGDSIKYNICQGDNILIVTDNVGCDTIIHFSVIVPPYDSSLKFNIYKTDTNSIILKYQPITLYINGPSDMEYIWEPHNTLNTNKGKEVIARPYSNTTYYARITDEKGCIRYTDSIVIYVKDVICGEPYIYIPNAFTPDGDNINDILFVRSNIIQDIYFAIFDRWGEKVFETRDITKGWDGRYKNRLVSPAVFDYYLEVTCFGGEKYFKKGNVTVIR